MRIAQINFLKKLFWFLFGLSNIIPSQISLMQRVVNLVEINTTPDNSSYLVIVSLIIAFKVIVFSLTFYSFYDLVIYAKRYNIFSS
jgi:hypothetical protein